MADFISSVLISFITIFVVMDPIPGIIPFLAYTKKNTDEQRKACAGKAVLIAGALAVLFLFAGPALLDFLHISFADFKIAGGILLALLGVETVLGITIGHHNKESINDVAVLIATPLLTGPGLATSLIVLARDNGLGSTLVALALALILSWLTLLNSIKLRNIVGEQMINIAAKIIGLLLLALGIAYIRAGLLV